MAEVHGNPETKIQSNATPDRWLLILKDHIALTKSHARDELVQRNLDQLIALLQAAFGDLTPAGRPDREAVARTINPDAFNPKPWMKGMMHERRHALKIADAILALYPAAPSEASRINADHFLIIMEECGLPYEDTPRAAVQICEYLEGRRELL